MAFVVIKGTGTTLENDLFLIGTGKHKGHCHLTSSVKCLLDSEIFRKHNAEIVETFEVAYDMMKNNKEGKIELSSLYRYRIGKKLNILGKM